MEIINSVYRFLNKKNEVIYIGKAKNLKNRISGHNHLPQECYDERVKIEYIEFNNEDDMDFAERYFISTVKPKYNDVYKWKDITLTIPELEFSIWNTYVNNKNNTSEYYNAKNEYSLIDEINKLITEKETQKNMLDKLLLKDNDINFKNIIDEEKNVLVKDIENLLNKRYKLEMEELKLKIGNDKFNLIPRWKKDLMIELKCVKDEELIHIKLNKIKTKILKCMVSDIDTKGYFNINHIKWKISEFLIFNKHKSDTLWLNLLEDGLSERDGFGGNVAISEIEKIVNDIYNNCISELINLGMNLVQDIIVVKETQPFQFIKMDTPKLVMKIA